MHISFLKIYVIILYIIYIFLSSSFVYNILHEAENIILYLQEIWSSCSKSFWFVVELPSVLLQFDKLNWEILFHNRFLMVRI